MKTFDITKLDNLDEMTSIRVQAVAKSQDGAPLSKLVRLLSDPFDFSMATDFTDLLDAMLAHAISNWSYESFPNPPHENAKIFEDRGINDLKYAHKQIGLAIAALELNK